MHVGLKALLVGLTAIFFSILISGSSKAKSCRVQNISPEILFNIVPYKVKFRKGITRVDLQRIARRHNNIRHPKK